MNKILYSLFSPAAYVTRDEAAKIITAAKNRLGKPSMWTDRNARIYQWIHDGFDVMTVVIKVTK